MNFLPSFLRRQRGSQADDTVSTDVHGSDSTAKGRPANPENSTRHLYNRMQVDARLRAVILDIRHMDRVDGRVKVIHKRMARDVTRGGLMLKWRGSENRRVTRLWEEYVNRLGLKNRNKLMSDARGLAMEGNLPIQWVIDSQRVIGGVRMPTETIVPNVDINGRFSDMAVAYRQMDPLSTQELASFPLWQLSLIRMDPDNFDDMGCLGRPYLDANRTVWNKLIMTEEDLVIRRRTRAPQKLAHILEGASKDEIEEYRERVESESGEITTDYYLNKKGAVTAVEGDANMDQIADVAYLLDTFFSGSPAPKGLFGYVGDLNRDVLEDLKADYFEEIDGLQDCLSECYTRGFHLNLLLHGLNPDAYDFTIQYAERRTETRNQRADYALKLQALGTPRDIVWEHAGLDVLRTKNKLKEQQKEHDPYPTAEPGDNKRPTVSVTPGNAPKGESATSITTRNG